MYGTGPSVVHIRPRELVQTAMQCSGCSALVRDLAESLAPLHVYRKPLSPHIRTLTLLSMPPETLDMISRLVLLIMNCELTPAPLTIDTNVHALGRQT
jgi:hypothetical protein